VFSTFLIIILFFNSQMALRLTKLLVVAIGIQSLYGVIYYVLGINQFVTPEFGQRTGGTFEGFGRTNAFYPLCLLGIPLSLSLAEVQSSVLRRWTFRAVSGVTLLALVFTYSRAGWLALIPPFLYLAFSLYSPLHVSRLGRGLMVALVVVFLMGTVFIRTKGQAIGHPHDRSFWGRVAIWQVTARIVMHHPWLGGGLSSYRTEQYEHLTPQLKRFNPLNVEAKCLYLNIAAEFGMVGLALFAFMAWRYAPLHRSVMHSLSPASEARATVGGIHAGALAVMVAGLMDTPVLQFDRQPSSFALAALAGILCVLVNAMHPVAPYSPPAVSGDSASPLPPATLRRWKRVGAGALLVVGVTLLYLTVCVTQTVRMHLPAIERLRTQNPPTPRFVPLHRVAQPLRDATLAMEDYRFYEHKGIDWEAMHRALRKNVRAVRLKEGGSTITMQLAKNLFLPRERTLPRKLSEIVLGRYLEKRLSKDRILELYLNVIDYGLGARGIGAAAQTYFGKPPSALTLAESALLAGLVPRPPKGSLDAVYAEKARREALRRISRVFPSYTPEELERASQERLPANVVAR